MNLTLPRLYAILDPALLPKAPEQSQIDAVVAFARNLSAGGVSLIQYRNKSGSGREILSEARELRSKIANEITWIMNDRADLCIASGFSGVHVGQDDLSPEGARAVCKPPLLVGVSTHNIEQVRAADTTSADYIAVGPVFGTTSKANPDPILGLEGVRAARAVTKKPLVAIGGINLENCRQVLEAGADSIAVISALIQEPRKSSEEFLRVLM